MPYQDAVVDWFRTIVVLALLALWVPVSSHAFLQHADLIHHHDTLHHGAAEHEHGHGPANSNDHDAADGICRVQSHSAKAPCPDFTIVFLVNDYAADFAACVLYERPEHAGPSPPGTAPPPPSGPRAPPSI